MGQPAHIRATGAIFYLCAAALWSGGAYWLWPDGVTDVPLSSLTLGALLRATGAIVCGFCALFCIGGAISDATD